MVRRGEYAARGDYHRTPDPSWDYCPTYLAKLDAVRRYLIVMPFVRRYPRAPAPLHRALTRLLPIPGWCLLNLLTVRKA